MPVGGKGGGGPPLAGEPAGGKGGKGIPRPPPGGGKGMLGGRPAGGKGGGGPLPGWGGAGVRGGVVRLRDGGRRGRGKTYQGIRTVEGGSLVVVGLVGSAWGWRRLGLRRCTRR